MGIAIGFAIVILPRPVVLNLWVATQLLHKNHLTTLENTSIYIMIHKQNYSYEVARKIILWLGQEASHQDQS
jgi:hypothetical protein